MLRPGSVGILPASWRSLELRDGKKCSRRQGCRRSQASRMHDASLNRYKVIVRLDLRRSGLPGASPSVGPFGFWVLGFGLNVGRWTLNVKLRILLKGPPLPSPLLPRREERESAQRALPNCAHWLAGGAGLGIKSFTRPDNDFSAGALIRFSVCHSSGGGHSLMNFNASFTSTSPVRSPRLVRDT